MPRRESYLDDERTILNYISSLSRANATRILSIVGLIFIYFQIVLSKEAVTVFSQTPRVVFPLGVEVTPVTLAFGFLSSILFWQVNGLLLYARMEVHFVYTQKLPEDMKIERPLTRKIIAVGESILEKRYHRPLYHFSGFRDLTSFLFPSNPKNKMERINAFVFLVLVTSTYIFLIFPASIRFIMFIIPSSYIVTPRDYDIQHFAIYFMCVAIILGILLSVHSYGWHKLWERMRYMIVGGSRT